MTAALYRLGHSDGELNAVRAAGKEGIIKSSWSAKDLEIHQRKKDGQEIEQLSRMMGVSEEELQGHGMNGNGTAASGNGRMAGIHEEGQDEEDYGDVDEQGLMDLDV